MRVNYYFRLFVLSPKSYFILLLFIFYNHNYQLKGQDSARLQKIKRNVEIISQKIDALEHEFDQTSINIEKVEKEIAIESDLDIPEIENKKLPISNNLFAPKDLDEISSSKINNPKNQKLERLRKTFQDIQEGVNNLYQTKEGTITPSPNKYIFNNRVEGEIQIKNQDLSFNDKQIVDQIQPKRASYYIAFRPSIHFANDLDYNFIHGPKGEIQTDGGYGVSLDLGKKLGNGDLGISLGLNQTNFRDLKWLGSTLQADGESIAYQLLFSGSYRFELSEQISLRTGGALGFANRHEHYNISLLSPSTLDEDSLTFNGQLSIAFAFQILNDFFLTTGYRFSYLGESGSFGEMYLNAFEVGLAWDL